MTVDENAQDGLFPRHVAIIMDGNGRWAKQRGLPRTAGHKHGVEAVKNVATAARDIGIEYLTLYAFSSENWSRPESEISELFSLLKLFIRRDLAELHQNNVKLRIIGQEQRVPDDIHALLTDAEALTAENTGQNLIIAFNYGARNEIVEAARTIALKARDGRLDPDDIDADVFASHLETSGIPDPDLIIRTSGELRLSNFLLWQAAYSELVFADCLWPDFGKAELELALGEFSRRTRRFGSVDRETGS